MSSTAHSRLLVVDDEPDLRTLYELTLVREGYAVETAGTVEAAWDRLRDQPYDLVITDLRLPDGSGMDLLRRLDDDGRRERTIVITAYGSAENAVEALKAGAYDYLTKPVDLKQFRSVVASAVGRGASTAAAPSSAKVAAARGAVAYDGPERRTGPRRRGVGFGDNASATLARMAGTSPIMSEVRGLIAKVARSMAPVLVHGESGSGKELVARAIHEVSVRAGQPFVAVNCGAIPEALLEAEFFGYRKGAFTGAMEDREGFFQAASGGTLFLDEIGDLPLSMQSKLLRVIQERAVRPVGATQELPADVRIVSATHKDLAREVVAGRFRQDLYYRLNVICIEVPPLRQRLGDLPVLCEGILKRIAQDAGAEPVRLSEAALARLGQYAFPGNVRELENLLHRAVALCAGPEILPDDIGLVASGEPEAPPAETAEAAAIEVAPRTEVDTPASLPTDLSAHLDAIEREVLLRALKAHRNNRTAAGAALGLSLRQMRYRMARLGIGGDDPGEAGVDPGAP